MNTDFLDFILYFISFTGGLLLSLILSKSLREFYTALSYAVGYNTQGREIEDSKEKIKTLKIEVVELKKMNKALEHENTILKESLDRLRGKLEIEIGQLKKEIDNLKR